jgi:hypothetical protein
MPVKPTSTTIEADAGVENGLSNTSLQRAPRNITREIEDDYAKVVFQQEKWRVIECKDAIQWIIQRCGNLSHAKPRWKPISYCTTRKALIRVWHTQTGEHSVVLDKLPERNGGQTNAV